MPLLPLSEIQQLSPLFRGRVGHASARALMRLLRIDEMNNLYDRNGYLHGSDFACKVLSDLGIEYDVYGTTSTVLKQWDQLKKPFITISNHPYGGIDGIILAALFGQRFPQYKIMVNKILGRIEALSPSFITVTPVGVEHTAPAAESIVGIRHALAHLRQGGSLGLFPSGAVSDLRLCPYGVRDRSWPLPMVRFIAKAHVPIIPVHFLDGNSWLYYALGLIGWRVRLLRLPGELFNKRGCLVRLVVGEAVTVDEQQHYLSTHSLEEYGLWLREKVYGC